MTRRMIALGTAAVAVMLLLGCEGTSPKVDEPPADPLQDALVGFWTGTTTVPGEEIDREVEASLQLTPSRFIVVYELAGGGTSVISGGWKATAASVDTAWIDGHRATRSSLPYTLDGESLTITLRDFPRLPDAGITITLTRQQAWQAADLVGRWEERWDWDDGRSRSFALTYNADGMCAWRDFRDNEPANRPNFLVSFEGTCTVDTVEHFLHMKVTSVAVTEEREPFKGHTLRFGFARTPGPDTIVVSVFWQEVQYLPLEDEWRDNPFRPHGGYWLWLDRQ